MKRFVDVRNQGIGGAFAWYDTVIDEFEEHSDSMDWNSWDEFEQDYEGIELERYRVLTPEWAHKGCDDPDKEFFS